MKKLLYVSIITVLGLAAYVIWDKFFCEKADNKSDVDPPVVLATKDKPITNEFIIKFPKDTKSKAYAVFSAFINKHFKTVTLKKSCPCGDDLQLWEGIVDFDPDKDPPTTTSQDTSMVMRPNDLKSSKSIDTDKSKVPSSFLIRNYPIAINARLASKYKTSVDFLKSASVKIAILDTGIDTTHSALKRYLLRNPTMAFLCDSRIAEGQFGMNMLKLAGEQTYSEPIDEDGHGTFINGIIAGFATYPPAYNRREKARNVSLDLLNVKIGNSTESGSTLFKALCGMHYAVKKKVDIINASWHITPRDVDINSIANAFLPVMDEIKAANIMLVASAGNKGKEDLTHLPSSFARPFRIRVGTSNFVADYSNNVVSVGAWNTIKDVMYINSNRGSNVDIYAPGQYISSLGLGGESADGSGTSYATPFVTQRLAELIGVDRTNLKSRLISGHSRLVGTDTHVLNMR